MAENSNAWKSLSSRERQALQAISGTDNLARLKNYWNKASAEDRALNRRILAAWEKTSIYSVSVAGRLASAFEIAATDRKVSGSQREALKQAARTLHASELMEILEVSERYDGGCYNGFNGPMPDPFSTIEIGRNGSLYTSTMRYSYENRQYETTVRPF